MGAACGWCVGFGFRSLVVSSSVRDPRCWFLVCWCCFGCVGSACPACVALCCSALPCVRFVCSGRDELIVLSNSGSHTQATYQLATCPNTHPNSPLLIPSQPATSCQMSAWCLKKSACMGPSAGTALASHRPEWRSRTTAHGTPMSGTRRRR